VSACVNDGDSGSCMLCYAYASLARKKACDRRFPNPLSLVWCGWRGIPLTLSTFIYLISVQKKETEQEVCLCLIRHRSGRRVDDHSFGRLRFATDLLCARACERPRTAPAGGRRQAPHFPSPAARQKGGTGRRPCLVSLFGTVALSFVCDKYYLIMD